MVHMISHKSINLMLGTPCPKQTKRRNDEKLQHAFKRSINTDTLLCWNEIRSNRRRLPKKAHPPHHPTRHQPRQEGTQEEEPPPPPPPPPPPMALPFTSTAMAHTNRSIASVNFTNPVSSPTRPTVPIAARNNS